MKYAIFVDTSTDECGAVEVFGMDASHSVDYETRLYRSHSGTRASDAMSDIRDFTIQYEEEEDPRISQVKDIMADMDKKSLKKLMRAIGLPDSSARQVRGNLHAT